MRTYLLFYFFALPMGLFAQIQLVTQTPEGALKMTSAGASYFAGLSLECTGKVYPHFYEENTTLEKKEDLKYPDQLWPSFYGCFDWHSGVHNHWALVKLLKKFPNIPEAKMIREKLDLSFNADNIQKETRYLIEHEYPLEFASQEFEFPYGKSWLLKVADELIRWNHPDAKRWLNNLKPLTDYITNRYLQIWPYIQKPVFTGAHRTSSMGISFALDYARSSGNTELEKLMIEKAKRFYSKKVDYDLSKEPDDYDFMSCGLLVVDLMRKVYDADEFMAWSIHFVPQLYDPVLVDIALQIKKTDKHDGFESHWDGFHLNRIWCINGMLKSLPKSKADPQLVKSWRLNQKKMWEYAQESIGKGNYDIDHWLSTFSVFALLGYED